MALPTTLFSVGRSFAPKNWADRMLAPVDTPINSTSSRFRMGPEVPTAARAVSPIYWPTTMESTVLYNC